MQYYLLVCRSLTYAQRVQAVLQRHGIASSVIRSTKDTKREGCGYSVKIKETSLDEAQSLLKGAGLLPRGLMMITSDGKTVEVAG